MIKRVVHFNPRLGVNPFSEVEVLGRGYVPVINARPIESSSIPCRSNLAFGTQCTHVRVEIVVEGTLALGQDWIPSEYYLIPIAPAGDVLVAGRAQVDIHGLARNK